MPFTACFASLRSMTPLHFAATFGAADVARVLMAHGADESLADANGVSARDVATTSVRVAIEALTLVRACALALRYSRANEQGWFGAAAAHPLCA
jgi:ankyrin repeat protein